MSGEMQRARGYVLIFVAGILLLVTVIVLGAATSLRLDAQLTLREKEQTQNETLLRGGLQYLLAQLATTRAVDQMGGAVDASDKGEMGLWRVPGGPYVVRLKAGSVRIDIDDAGWLPDANQLTDKEWQRLFVLLSASADNAARWTRRVLDERGLVAARSGRSGFASIDELLAIADIPPAIRFGQGSNREAVPGLRDLLVVGSRLKQLEVNRTPPLLFRVLLEVKAEDVERLANARRDRKLTVAEAGQILGQTSSLLYVDRSQVWRATVVPAVPDEQSPPAGTARYGLSALLREAQTSTEIVDQRLGLLPLPLPAGRGLNSGK